MPREENKLNPAKIQGGGTPALAHFHLIPCLPAQAPKSWQSPAQKPPGESSPIQGMQVSGFPTSNRIATSPSWERSWTLAPFSHPAQRQTGALSNQPREHLPKQNVSWDSNASLSIQGRTYELQLTATTPPHTHHTSQKRNTLLK